MFSFIEADNYRIVYYSVTAVLTLTVVFKYATRNQYQFSGRYRSLLLWILFIAVALFIGLRPVSDAFFYDMSAYNSLYLKSIGESFSFDWHLDNIIFDNLFLFLASIQFPVQYFFLLIAIIYFGCIAASCSLLFQRDQLAAFIVYLGAFSTFAYATNGIKAGAAAALFLLALAQDKRGRWFLVVLFLLLSLGFHHSMVLPIVAFAICKILRNPRIYIVLWVVAFILAAFHMTFIQHFFAGFVDEQGAMYLLGEEEHVRHDILGGFRIDFILYSLVPILIGWFALLQKVRVSQEYIFLLNLYTLTNAVWLLCMYAEFTNRIAYLSWFMLPIVLIYPFLEERWSRKQFQTFQLVAVGHLAFTLVLQFI